jgi:hypothetical protein
MTLLGQMGQIKKGRWRLLSSGQSEKVRSARSMYSMVRCRRSMSIYVVLSRTTI